jgi:hypothetical protein
MSGMPWCRIKGAVIYPMPPYGDVGDHVSVMLDAHPYPLCECGVPILFGQTMLGATVFVCGDCERILDVRRVA